MPAWNGVEPDVARNLVWLAAFLVGMRLYCSQTHEGRDRFALGLFCGAMFAHLGWALVHLPLALEHSQWVFQPGAASVLFFPLGVLVVAPRRESLGALPLTLFTARLGCLPHTCCYEAPRDAAFELIALVLLHALARKIPRLTLPVVLSGLGLIRFLSVSVRAQLRPEPFIDPAWFAGLLIVLGALFWRRPPSLGARRTLGFASGSAKSRSPKGDFGPEVVRASCARGRGPDPGKWRVFFRWHDAQAHDVQIADYHRGQSCSLTVSRHTLA